MPWHKDPIQHGEQQHRCRQRCPSGRGGSLIIEAVIAAALLATATLGLTKLAKSAAVLSQQSDQRLAATLAAENTLERLRVVPVERLVEQAGEVAKIVAAASACEVEVSTEPCTARERDGIHLRVDVSPVKNIRVSLHDWRFASDKPKESEPSEDPSISKQPTETADALPREVDDA